MLKQSRNFLPAVILALALTAPAAAQPGRPSTLPQVADLFVGAWLGHGMTPASEKFTSELNFSWTLDKNFIEVRNKIDDGKESRQFALTIYGWQPVLGKVVFWSFDRDGTINEGLATLEGTTLTHEWRSFSKGGEIRDWRSTLDRFEENRLRFTLMEKSGQVIYAIEYKKQK